MLLVYDTVLLNSGGGGVGGGTRPTLRQRL
jgi:hypothetical protein